eukprot:GHVL01003792.1.p1 GENE.GHVL01003792.1~~GHVL01003792.1.p1  ORF type:complete len:126 (-),score=6.29 GHVL01003792.1:21-398(-)
MFESGLVAIQRTSPPSWSSVGVSVQLAILDAHRPPQLYTGDGRKSVATQVRVMLLVPSAMKDEGPTMVTLSALVGPTTASKKGCYLPFFLLLYYFLSGECFCCCFARQNCRPQYIILVQVSICVL